MCVEEEELLPADIILVPGGSHKIPMQIACQLYKIGYAPYILPSGGYNAKINCTEWEFLKNIGLSLGVPEDVILKEDQAKNTFDNARNSWKVINEHNLQLNSAIIVCKSFFSRRALMTYQTIFPTSTQFYVKQDNVIINRENWYLDEESIRKVLTEAEKITKYFGHHIPNWVKDYKNQDVST